MMKIAQDGNHSGEHRENCCENTKDNVEAIF